MTYFTIITIYFLLPFLSHDQAHYFNIVFLCHFDFVNESLESKDWIIKTCLIEVSILMIVFKLDEMMFP
ncbi:hypothetical protein Hanom_Chr08g00688151 [Helianthus anomalus]